MFANRTIGGVKIPCVALYIVCVIVIILYGYFLRMTKTQDILAKRIYHHPICQDIDGWSITHFLFFGLLGILYPGRHLQFFAVGVFWEVVETALGQNNIEISGKRLQLLGEQDEEGNSTGKTDAYWYGKESDIVVDVCGYAIGSYFAEKYWPNECELPSPAAAPGPPSHRPIYIAPPAWI